MVNCHKKIHSIEAQHTQDGHEGVKTHFVTFNQILGGNSPKN